VRRKISVSRETAGGKMMGEGVFCDMKDEY